MLIDSSRETWQAYVQHEFVKQLAKGTLPKECFLHFIKCAISPLYLAP